MKKILLLSFLAISMLCSNAQTARMKGYSSGATVDTIGNSSVDTLHIKVNNIWPNLAIQVVFTGVGTRVDSATSTAKIYGSLNDTNFVQIGSTTFTTTNSSATVVNSYEWTPLVADKYLYYAVISTAGGNDSSSVKAYITYKGTPWIAIAPQPGNYVRMSSTNTVAANTNKVTNGGTDTLVTQINRSHLSVSIQPVVTKVSGTVLAGVQLQYSEDGSHYFDSAGDSLHCTNVSTAQSTIWNIPATTAQHQYYRLLVKGYAGTQVANVKAYIVGK